MPRNFGTMLTNLGRWKEAVAMLEGALRMLEPQQRATISAFVEQCRGHLVPDTLLHRAR